MHRTRTNIPLGKLRLAYKTKTTTPDGHLSHWYSLENFGSRWRKTEVFFVLEHSFRHFFTLGCVDVNDVESFVL